MPARTERTHRSARPGEDDDAQSVAGLGERGDGELPFSNDQIELDRFGSSGRTETKNFAIRSDNAMTGVDYPAPETAYPALLPQVKTLVDHPGVTDADARKVLFENAADLFRFDLAFLAPHIEQASVHLDDIPEPQQDQMQMSSLFEVASLSRSTPG